MTTVLAVDLGSASGRVLAGTFADGRVEVADVHRFKHQALRDGARLTWDVETMWEQTVIGLRKAVAAHPDAVSVSIDTWGVDFAPLDADDELVGPVRAYRDERTSRTLGEFRSRLGDREFFDLTGLQPATINTANQLVALLVEEPELAARVASVLYLPDYFAWRLTGVKGWSRTIASTSGLAEPGAGRFSDEVFERLGIPRRWVGGISADRTVVGQCSVPGLEGLTVVRGGAHDSACAVHGLPIDEGKRAYFLSCGSWSVSKPSSVTDSETLSSALSAVSSDPCGRPMSSENVGKNCAYCLSRDATRGVTASRKTFATVEAYRSASASARSKISAETAGIRDRTDKSGCSPLATSVVSARSAIKPVTRCEPNRTRTRAPGTASSLSSAGTW